MVGLFDPAVIGPLWLKNRFVRSATAECMADHRGMVTDRLISFYSTLAEGNIGLLITGGAYVHPSGRSYVGVTGVHDDSTVPGLARLTDAIHERGSRVVLQLYHCGRQGEPEAAGGTLLAPSAAPDRLIRIRPKALSVAQIRELIASFGNAAGRAAAAGFDGVQILAANGYLINQFLSPHCNQRDDEWGGSLANRMRFLLEVLRAVRRGAGPDMAVLVKLTAGDFVRGGLSPEESLAVALALAAEGVDALEITGGTLESFFYMSRGEIPVDQILSSRQAANLNPVARHLVRAAATTMRGRVKFQEAYFASHAEAVRKATGVPVILVGGLRSPQTMEWLLRRGQADLVALARPFLREPHFVRRVQAGDDRPALCRSCNRCLVTVADGDGVRCFDLRNSR
jgi:2,4-dienoyl-CoA reductase-like NADH-dependent reductase (Old Yellow Enzyme family)